jgi:transposase
MVFVAEEFEVSPGDRAVLESWIRSESLPQAWGQRARIILASADGEGVREMSRRLQISTATVCTWRKRFRKLGLTGLKTKPRSGRPKQIDEKRERAVLAATLKAPRAGTHWSTRRLAREVGLSPASVHRIWAKHGLQPHRVTTFRWRIRLPCAPHLRGRGVRGRMRGDRAHGRGALARAPGADGAERPA